ncbi:MAG: hypothetical protein GXP46_03000 [Deferribacteres bacterium]|nr:hypothetical protein [Deferribacteres bacterium]
MIVKNKFRNLTVVSLVLSLICLAAVLGSCVSVLSAPVVPNESVIEGVVSEYAILSSRIVNIQPPQVLYRLTIRIESSEGAARNMPDFAGGMQGRDIRFYSKERLSPDLFGKRVRARVKYKGDERGGLFWISSVEITGR